MPTLPARPPMAPTKHRAPRSSSAPTNALREAQGLFLGCLLSFVFCWRFVRWLCVAPLTLAGLIIYFFRDPVRSVTPPAQGLLAPADGTVIAVSTVYDDYWQEEMIEVRLFLSLFNVHIQRSPLAAQVVDICYTPGKRLSALSPLAATSNEHNSLYLCSGNQHFTLIQVAGLVARTLVVWVDKGALLEAGEKIGMIKFGSQTALRFPNNFQVLVTPGALAQAGVTFIAKPG